MNTWPAGECRKNTEQPRSLVEQMEASGGAAPKSAGPVGALALPPCSAIGRSKNITIIEYEKRGCRWRRDVDDIAGWWCLKIQHKEYALWDCGDGLWVEPNGQTMLYPSREAAAEKAALYGRAGKVLSATEAFSPNIPVSNAGANTKA